MDSSYRKEQLLFQPIPFRQLRHSHLLHLDFYFPDALFSPFTAFAESRYLGGVCTIDIPAGLSVIVSSVIAVEEILDSGGRILLFEAGESYARCLLRIDELLHLYLKSQICDIAMRGPYILIAHGVC